MLSLTLVLSLVSIGTIKRLCHSFLNCLQNYFERSPVIPTAILDKLVLEIMCFCQEGRHLLAAVCKQSYYSPVTKIFCVFARICKQRD
jgi:hypothetical protein